MGSALVRLKRRAPAFVALRQAKRKVASATTDGRRERDRDGFWAGRINRERGRANALSLSLFGSPRCRRQTTLTHSLPGVRLTAGPSASTHMAGRSRPVRSAAPISTNSLWARVWRWTGPNTRTADMTADAEQASPPATSVDAALLGQHCLIKSESAGRVCRDGLMAAREARGACRGETRDARPCSCAYRPGPGEPL
jgi:hypothetical protein